LAQESQEKKSGTSNDRILWTMPNVLTVEDADKIPPLTPGQKFKVVARGVFGFLKRAGQLPLLLRLTPTTQRVNRARAT
jgi:hypothetical protein